jgi:hypothetical protein
VPLRLADKDVSRETIGPRLGLQRMRALGSETPR